MISDLSDGTVINANFALSDADGGEREGNHELSTPPVGPGNFKNPAYWPSFILLKTVGECPINIWAEETVENGIALAAVNALALNQTSEDEIPRVTVLTAENKDFHLPLRSSSFGTYLWGRHTILPGAEDSVLTMTVRSGMAEYGERTDTLVLELPRHRRSRAVRMRYPVEKLESLPEQVKNLGSLYRDCALEIALNPKMATLLKQSSVDSTIGVFTGSLDRLLTAREDELDREWRFSHIQAFRSAVTNNCVPYKLYAPSEVDTTKRYPVYFRLHGGDYTLSKPKFIFGDLKNSQDLYIRKGGTDRFTIIVYGKGNAYMTSGREDIERLYSWALENLPVDTARMHIGGHSQGGRVSLHYGVRYPDRFAFIKPQAGSHRAWMPEGVGSSEKKYRQVLNGRIDKIENLRHSRIYLSTGEKDNYAFSSNELLAERMVKLGMPFAYKSFPGVGHHGVPSLSPPDNLEQHKLPRVPRNVVFRTGSITCNKSYWITVDLIEKPGYVADIRGSIVHRNDFRIQTDNIEQFTIHPKEYVDTGDTVRLRVDSSIITMPVAGVPFRVSLRKSNGSWISVPDGTLPEAEHLKTNQCAGPVSELIANGFVIAYGTSAPQLTPYLRERAFAVANEWTGYGWEQLGGAFIGVYPDTALEQKSLDSSNVWLIGGKRENKLTNRLAPGHSRALEMIRNACSDEHRSSLTGVLQPHPTRKDGYVYIETGTVREAYGAEARGVERMIYDYWVMRVDGKRNPVVFAGLFDNRWEWYKDGQIITGDVSSTSTR